MSIASRKTRKVFKKEKLRSEHYPHFRLCYWRNKLIFIVVGWLSCLLLLFFHNRDWEADAGPLLGADGLSNLYAYQTEDIPNETL